jgi:hypothetical protein
MQNPGAALLTTLADYMPIDAGEAYSVAQLKRLLRDEPGCFMRETLAGHITGSAWILNPTLDRALLTHHRKLGLWLQLGGHCDGDPDVHGVALREGVEESGLHEIAPLSDKPFDIDVHVIPRHGEVPAHNHHDIIYAFTADDRIPFTVSAESIALAWVGLGDSIILGNRRLTRLAQKTRDLIDLRRWSGQQKPR